MPSDWTASQGGTNADVCRMGLEGMRGSPPSPFILSFVPPRDPPARRQFDSHEPALRFDVPSLVFRGTKMRSTSRSGATVLAIALLLVAPSAWAVTFDFAAVAAGGPISWDAVTDTGERGYASFSMTVGGLTVTATASIPPLGPPPEPLASSGPDGTTPLTPASSEAEVYLDGPIQDALGNTLVGGMGVCKPHAIVGGGSNQCAQSSDDDVSSGETLRLMFSSPVTLTGITFRNASHGTSFTGRFVLSNGGWSVSPLDRKSTRLNSSHTDISRMPSSA